MGEQLTWTNAKRKLSDLVPWEHNPRQIDDAQRERLAHSWDEFGQVESLAIDPNNTIINGHQRKKTLEALERYGPDFEVDVRVASRVLTEKEQKKLSVLLVKASGDWDWTELGTWDEVDLLAWGLEEGEFQFEISDNDSFLSVAKDAKPNPRKLPIDVIYTLQGADATCCLAVRAGLKYGIQSASYTLCPYCLRGDDNHRVVFIDNDYFRYDHARHLDAVSSLRPKYATVMDIMTREQCARDKITWRPLEQILEWAAEIEQYAENVIVIPKYDCLNEIPEHYILGYSVPTSHGGTPLPVSAFKGRRVHLLGGSWKAQLAHLAELGDDVVCLDNNHVQNIARQWAQFVTPDGEIKNLTNEGYDWPTNPRYLALAFSFGAIGAKVNELLGATKEKISNSLAVAVTRLTKTRRLNQCIALS